MNPPLTLFGRSDVILWRATDKKDAYRDQCGRYHHGFVVEEEIRADIIEARLVPGDYSREVKDNQIGYRAKNPKNEQIFECNWHFWPDTSSTPYYCWYGFNKERNSYLDVYINAVLCAGSRYTPYVRNNQLAIPGGYPYCEKHMECHGYYNGKYSCLRCDFERRSHQ